MKTDLGYKYNLAIETITPTAVGSGESLNALSDYWVYKGEAYIIDQNKFEKLVESKPEYLSLYIESIKDQRNKGKDNFLFPFIKWNLKGNPQKFVSEKIKVIGQGNATKLKTCIQENGVFLIPGSTIKGALKSAMLYNWMMQEERKDEISNILKSLDKLKFLWGDAKENQIIDIKNKIDELLTQFLEKPITEKRMNFSLLQIEDAYFEKVSPVWVHTFRYSLIQKKANIPIFLEAIPYGVKSSFSIRVEVNEVVHNGNACLDKYYTENGMSTLITDINRYSKDNLEYEQSCVTKEAELSAYLNELNSLETQITQSDNHTAYIPLGFGKTNFYQSIGLALYNWLKILKTNDEEVLNFAFESYLQLFKIGKKIGNEWQKQLPITRTLIEGTEQPLGWVKLTIK
jgi:CRISPR type III-A-associated RAMP protein Csm5